MRVVLYSLQCLGSDFVLQECSCLATAHDSLLNRTHATHMLNVFTEHEGIHLVWSQGCLSFVDK